MEKDKNPPKDIPSELYDSDLMENISNLVREETGAIDAFLVDIAAHDRKGSEADEAVLAKEQKDKTGSFYSDIVYTIAHIRYSENEAVKVWRDLLIHKWNMSERMGRNIGIRVAALDYFSNILGLIDQAKIINAGDYIETTVLAITDGLTGLFNHYYFQERLKRDLERAALLHLPVCLCLFDIDHFKKYNDMNGHLAGDIALREVARILRRSVKRDDLVARYGGEEFCIILYNVCKPDAVRVAERVREQIRKMKFPNENLLPAGDFTISAGVSEFPTDAATSNDLIDSADRALYIAKNCGRNRICSHVEDRRLNPRFSMITTAHISTVAPKAPWDEALLQNISRGGLALRSMTPNDLDTLLRIQLPRLSEHICPELLGRIVWLRKHLDESTFTGVKFVSMGNKSLTELDNYLHSAILPER